MSRLHDVTVMVTIYMYYMASCVIAIVHDKDAKMALRDMNTTKLM